MEASQKKNHCRLLFSSIFGALKKLITRLDELRGYHTYSACNLVMAYMLLMVGGVSGVVKGVDCGKLSVLSSTYPPEIHSLSTGLSTEIS